VGEAVRNRLATVCVVTVVAAALVCQGWLASRHRPAQPPPPDAGDRERPRQSRQGPDGLSDGDEAALRAIVAEHDLATANWAPGGADPYDLSKAYRVLVPPRRVVEIYARNPLGTLRCLKKIVEGGPTADAHAAIAYAHAAVGYADDDPVPLLHAHSYAYYPTAKEFEDLNPVIPKTYRQFAVEEIDGLIERVEKQLKEKQAGQEHG
jgi:hypothetical protein